MCGRAVPRVTSFVVAHTKLGSMSRTLHTEISRQDDETRYPYPDTPCQDDNVQFPDQDENYFDSSSLSDAIDNVEFSYFVDAVESEECAFMQLSSSIFVANGWNRKKVESTVRLEIIFL